MKNKQVLLASRPSGWVSLDNFTVAEVEVGEPGDGEVLVRNIFMSVDPYMRGRMNDVKSYVPPFQIGEVLQAGVVGEVVASNFAGLAIGEVLQAGVVGEVVASNFAGLAEGDHVTGMLGWENYSICDGNLLRKLPQSAAPLSWHLGILGMPGMTAYVGLMKIAEAKAEDQVFVSAASGAVGSVVGQLAKILGCRVSGSAGSDEKVALLKEEFGYDAGFNYKIDVLFENVGGESLEAVLWSMRDFGRIALCGMIADYNAEAPQPGPRGMMVMVGRRITMRGFIVTDHPEACTEYVTKAIGWVSEGKLKYRETIAEGVENAPQAFMDLLQGGKTGKQIVQLS